MDEKAIFAHSLAQLGYVWTNERKNEWMNRILNEWMNENNFYRCNWFCYPFLSLSELLGPDHNVFSNKSSYIHPYNSCYIDVYIFDKDLYPEYIDCWLRVYP